MSKPDVRRLLEFQKLLLEFSRVERACSREHHGTFIRENDTEHSYNLAMSAWFLAGYFPKLDRDKLIRLSLAHDLVEVHAGDTDVYDNEDRLASKAAREAQALERLRADWPDFPGLLESIHEYEDRQSEEAKFVYALDKIMPIMLIYLNDGYTWKQKGITPERLDSVKQGKVSVSPDIEPYYGQLYALLLEHRELFGQS